MNLGKRVRALRKSLDLTQKQFVAKIGGKGDWTYLGKIERNDQWPSLKYLSKIAEAHNKPLSFFFEDEELEPSKINDLRREKVKSLACLVSRFNWELTEFRACRRACDQMPLCRTIKVLVNR